MLNLSGVDLIVDWFDRKTTSVEMIEYFDKHILSLLPNFTPWNRPAWPGTNSSTLTFPWPRTEPKFKLNRFVWPMGASRWAFGHFLASSDQVESIGEDAFNDDGSYNVIPFMLGNPEIADQVGTDDTSDNIITANVFMLPPTPLSGMRGLSGPVQSLYLITVVDQRFFWYQSSTGKLQLDGNTWDDLYTMLATQIALSSDQFSWDTIPDKYLNPSSSMFNLIYQPVPFALDAVAFNVGQRIVCNYDGTVRANNATLDVARIKLDFGNRSTRIILAGGPRFADPL
jgi:hypothetical protein